MTTLPDTHGWFHHPYEGPPGARLDLYLRARFRPFSRTRWARQVLQGNVLVNGHRVNPSRRMQPGDLMLLHPDTAGPEPPPGGISVIYEDRDLVAVCKDSGILVHPVRMMTRDTVIGFLRRRAVEADDDVAQEGLISPCHRLDKLTSGIVLLAKHADAARKMQAAFISGAVSKRYLALVTGRMEADSALCEEPIGPDLQSPVHIRNRVRPDGDACVTCVRVIERLAGHTLVEVEPRTGRKHQIRVHLAHLGHPIHGDLLYGPDLDVDYFENRVVNLGRDLEHWLALHAGCLDAPHPFRPGERLRLEAPPPERFLLKLEELRGCSRSSWGERGGLDLSLGSAAPEPSQGAKHVVGSPRSGRVEGGAP